MRFLIDHSHIEYLAVFGAFLLCCVFVRGSLFGGGSLVGGSLVGGSHSGNAYDSLWRFWVVLVSGSH